MAAHHNTLLPALRVDVSPSNWIGHGEQKELAIDAGEVRRVCHRNAVATGEGYLFRHFLPMKEASDNKLSRTSRILGMRWSQIRNAYRSSAGSLFHATRLPSAYWVTDNNSGNYFHWSTEVLPRLYLISQTDKACPVLLPSWLEKADFARRALSVLGLDGRFISEGRAVRVARLFTLSGTLYRPDILPGVGALFRDAPATGPERVYISRKDTDKRRVVNEAEIEDMLRARGFEIAETGGKLLSEQIALMSNCRTLVSMHGAGLSNMLYMPPGGKILEFRTYSECFVTLASVLGHEHYSLPTEKAGERSAHHAAAYVSPAGLEAALDRMGL